MMCLYYVLHFPVTCNFTNIFSTVIMTNYLKILHRQLINSCLTSITFLDKVTSIFTFSSYGYHIREPLKPFSFFMNQKSENWVRIDKKNIKPRSKT